MFTDAAVHRMLDAMDETGSGYTHASLHSAYSATGTNELTGGSPAYARIAVTGAAAGSPARAKVFTPAGAHNVPAGSTVAWVGRWNALTTGTFWGMAPAGAGPRRQFNVSDAADLTANLIDSPAHGLAADNRVVFWAAAGAGLPTGLSEGVLYWVLAAGLTTDAFAVSTTQGGSAVDITAVGDGEFQSAVPEVFAGQGTYTVTTDTLSMP